LIIIIIKIFVDFEKYEIRFEDIYFTLSKNINKIGLTQLVIFDVLLLDSGIYSQ